MRCSEADRLTKSAFDAMSHETMIRRHLMTRRAAVSAQESTERARKALKDHIANCGECRPTSHLADIPRMLLL